MPNPDKKLPLSTVISSLILFAVLVAVDLFTKVCAVDALRGSAPIPLIDGVLELRYLENRGAAFGMFQSGTFILSLISLAALIVLVVIYLMIPDGKKYLPLRLVLIFISAGAAGNLYDRITLKYVRDFIYFSLIDFPVFNVADIYVTCSVFILAFLIFFYYKEEDLQFMSSRGNTSNDK